MVDSCPLSDQSSYVLKVAGQNSYVHGGYELMEFAYVIRCLIKKTNIDLALVEKVDPSVDKLRDIEDVSKNCPKLVGIQNHHRECVCGALVQFGCYQYRHE